jgi:glycosyltransferase involved in cell wall biosynthesis
MASRAVNVPFVFTPIYHGEGHTALARVVHVPYRAVTPGLMSRCRSIICCSGAERDLLLADFPSCIDRTVVIPPAIGDPKSFDVEPFDVPGRVVLSTGRLDAYKHVDKTIRAVGRLDPSVHLVVTGDGPARGSLEEVARAGNLAGRVEFLGRVSDGDLRRWQRTAGVVVSLSTHESFGLSLAEALAAGASVVASDIPAHREMAELVGGPVTWVRAEDGDEDVARAISSALASSRQGRTAFVPRSWSDVGVEHMSIYEKVLGLSSH